MNSIYIHDLILGDQHGKIFLLMKCKMLKFLYPI